MNICFVLPRYSRNPIGGHKIVYEYANRLCLKGYHIYILFLNDKTFVEHQIPKFIRPIASNLLTKIEPKWFELNKKIVKLSALSNKDLKKLKTMNVCVATGVETVKPCETLFPLAKKIYFIQGRETWVASEDYVNETYRKGFDNIVVSSWLKKIVDEYSLRPATLIRNPIDMNIYKQTVPNEKRKSHTIGLLYHNDENKGLRYSYQVLEKLKDKYNDLDVYMFGTTEPNQNFPAVKKFIKNATADDLVKLYNTVSVFICSSIFEGYGLTGMEAMACGATLVSSDYEAVHEYAVNNVNALLSPVGNVDMMVDNVTYLFENEQDRSRLSKDGIKSLEKFNWETAIDTFIDVLEK